MKTSCSENCSLGDDRLICPDDKRLKPLSGVSWQYSNSSRDIDCVLLFDQSLYSFEQFSSRKKKYLTIIRNVSVEVL